MKQLTSMEQVDQPTISQQPQLTKVEASKI